MTASGYDVHYVTINRWRRQGWQANSNDDHPLDIARAKLEAIAPLATGNPIPAVAEDGEKHISDAALLRQESRKLSALSTQVLDAAERKLGKLVRSRTGELALLIQALAASGQAAVSALAQAEKLEHAASLPSITKPQLPVAGATPTGLSAAASIQGEYHEHKYLR